MKSIADFTAVSVEDAAQDAQHRCFRKVYRIQRKNHSKKWLIGILIASFLVLLLPWTQNIKASGKVTTLRQEQRPQELNTIIAGSVLKWYVKEGDFVKKGDTILQLGEVKVDYFDPRLLDQTSRQIEAKKMGARGYSDKALAADVQAEALAEGRSLKLKSLDNKIAQQQLKITSDSADLIAIINEWKVYTRQIEAAKQMLDSGAISLVDFERRKLNYQNIIAKKTSAENKWENAKQELANLYIEKNATVQEYADKIAKANAEKFASLSSLAGTEAEVAKLENLYSSYDIRNQLYYIRAPQNGQVVKAKKAGIGEILKEGEMVVEIVPDNIQYAVEIYIEPMDLPLVSPGQKVRFVFDGFPAIVFSGWPQTSYGTYGGLVIAVESSVSANGKFRALVVEDPKDRKWPEALKQGGGAKGIALLKNVPIFYELWRHINGFPPDYYKPAAASANLVK